MDDPDLRHLLDGPPPPASADDLRAIVRRAGRRTLRIGAGAAVVVLVAGGVGGYLWADHGTSSTAVVQTALAPAAQGATPSPALSPGATSGAAIAVAGGDVAPPGATTYRHDLTRTTSGGVTVRVFTFTTTSGSVNQRFIEVSTSAMVGTATAVEGQSSATTSVLGTDTGAPVVLVTAWAPAGVTEVHWSGEGGGDTMAPVAGFVALAVPVRSSPASGAAIGTLTFSDGFRITQTEQLHLSGLVAIPGCTSASPAVSPTVTSMGSTNGSAASSGRSSSVVCEAQPASGTAKHCVAASSGSGDIATCGSPPSTGTAPGKGCESLPSPDGAKIQPCLAPATPAASQ